MMNFADLLMVRMQHRHGTDISEIEDARVSKNPAISLFLTFGVLHEKVTRCFGSIVGHQRFR
jgi:hypothetical protein